MISINPNGFFSEADGVERSSPAAYCPLFAPCAKERQNVGTRRYNVSSDLK
jgi:hypothetical protein